MLPESALPHRADRALRLRAFVRRAADPHLLGDVPRRRGLFLALQKHYIQGLFLGSVKG
jgi:hypothetical protein